MSQKVLIFGLGLNQGGVGSALFFAKRGAQVKVTDLKLAEILESSINQLKDYPEIEYTLGEHKNEDIDWADLIIKNPGVKPGNPYIEYALKQGKQVEQDMGIFLNFVKPSQIIGITGTKGKSTTASLIYEIIKKSLGVRLVNTGCWLGRNVGNVVFAGNIGTSVLESLEKIKPDTLVVLELSSFQLESFDTHKVSPKWAVITNIYEDHLNYYKNMDEYTNAKKMIAKYQTPDDFLFLRKDDPATTQPEFLKDLRAKIVYFSKADLPADLKPILKGEHNLENISAALAVSKNFGIDEAQALETIIGFKGVPFRMELVKKWQGVEIYNDTTATGPDAGIQAIETFPNCILIAGGMNKGMDYTRYAKVLENGVKKVFFLTGDSTDEIIMSLRAKRTPSRSEKHPWGGNLDIHEPYDDLEKLLTDVKVVVQLGDTVLFSPAATSFNLFQNEFDRGRKFNAAVEKIFI